MTGEPEAVAGADRVVLPGRRRLRRLPARARRSCRVSKSALREAVIVRARPFLGICVGMQLMADRGREFETVDGPRLDRRRGGGDRARAIPRSRSRIWGGTSSSPSALIRCSPGSRRAPHAYFVHSYHFRPADPADLVAVTDYGGPLAAIDRA